MIVTSFIVSLVSPFSVPASLRSSQMKDSRSVFFPVRRQLDTCYTTALTRNTLSLNVVIIWSSTSKVQREDFVVDLVLNMGLSFLVSIAQERMTERIYMTH
jgi:hypothetical protein